MQHCTRATYFALFNSCRSCCLIALFVLFTSYVQHASADWSGGVEGGTVLRDSGNATRIRLVLKNDDLPFSQYLYAEWLRSSTGVGHTYALGYNPRYWLSDKNYVFGESGLRVDEPFLIDWEMTLLGGVGRQFINNANQGLFVEVGVGGRSIERYDDESFDTKTNTTEGLGLVRLGYVQTLADIIKFDLNLSGTLSSEDATEASSEVGLSLRLPQGSIRVAYRNRYYRLGDNESISQDDTFVSFGYGF